MIPPEVWQYGGGAALVLFGLDRAVMLVKASRSNANGGGNMSARILVLVEQLSNTLSDVSMNMTRQTAILEQVGRGLDENTKDHAVIMAKMKEP